MSGTLPLCTDPNAPHLIPARDVVTNAPTYTARSLRICGTPHEKG
jgi:hypothetical protein